MSGLRVPLPLGRKGTRATRFKRVADTRTRRETSTLTNDNLWNSVLLILSYAGILKSLRNSDGRSSGSVCTTLRYSDNYLAYKIITKTMQGSNSLTSFLDVHSITSHLYNAYISLDNKRLELSRSQTINQL